MITHYLKVALRQLGKYKAHSIISVLCLAVGITFFALMHLFSERFGAYQDTPGYERRITLRRGGRWLNADEIRRIDAMQLPGLDSLVVGSFQQVKTEVNLIDANQQELPYQVNHKAVNERYFAYYGLEKVSGDVRMLKEDEVVVHENFARKVFGNENPIGLSLRFPRQNSSYRIVGVVSGKETGVNEEIDVYFPMSAPTPTPFYVETFIREGVTKAELNKQLGQIRLDPADENSYLYATYWSDRDKDKTMIEIASHLIGILILLSGLVNFWKFIIQMFYNRQRELAIRKCVGSGLGGTFWLLFAECFCMMSAALFLSLVISEASYAIAILYFTSEMISFISFPELCWTQVKVYLGVLAVCLLVILYPVWRLRKASVIRTVLIGRQRHWFRNAMIGVQMIISLFFVSGSIVIGLAMNEFQVSEVQYLSEEEEEHTAVLSLNTLRIVDNRDAILSEISTLPEVTEQSALDIRGIEQYDNGENTYYVYMSFGPPSYFQFFRIPMEGKIVDEKAGNMIYVSRAFYEQLLKDGVEGMVKVGGKEYQIVGVYEALYDERKRMDNYIGSAFVPIPNPDKYCFRIDARADMDEMMEKLTAICRKYVPETLPLELRRLTDKAQTYEGMEQVLYASIWVLAFVSLLIVVLSIYSAISMDTVGRQKEVAIRKINGATPKVIAWLFGKTYVFIYLITFILFFPIIRLILMEMFFEFESVYRWDWVIVLFFGMALLIFIVTAYRIYRIMIVNPAEIIKKE